MPSLMMSPAFAHGTLPGRRSVGVVGMLLLSAETETVMPPFPVSGRCTK
ncbi:hypothetical protein [Actinoallomurus iriomotensis]|nr:hypothetical protein [Actinoallomurus iriomotensis]